MGGTPRRRGTPEDIQKRNSGSRHSKMVDLQSNSKDSLPIVSTAPLRQWDRSQSLYYAAGSRGGTAGSNTTSSRTITPARRPRYSFERAAYDPPPRSLDQIGTQRKPSRVSSDDRYFAGASGAFARLASVGAGSVVTADPSSSSGSAAISLMA